MHTNDNIYYIYIIKQIIDYIYIYIYAYTHPKP